MDKVVIVMPAYNEAQNIALMVHELFSKEFPKIDGVEMHLLVVDDFSPDGTGDVVKNLMNHHKNLHILQKEKEGLGWAYVRGMQYAMNKLHADAILEMDADFQHPPRFVRPMVEAYLSGADYAIGSRYIKGGSVPSEWAISRKAVSFFGNLFIRIVLLNFKVHDLTTGFRLSRVNGVLDKINLEKLMDLDRFAYKVDLLYQCLKNSKKIVEVPLEFAARTKEKSKFNWKEMVATFTVAVILGIKDKQRFIKFGVVGGTGFVVNYVGLEVLKRFGFTTFVATLLATEAAIISNFIFNNIWTFKDKIITKVSDIFVQFFKFNFSSLFAVIVQPFIVSGAAKLFGDSPLVHLGALLFALFAVVLPYNYTVYNLFIWRTWHMPKFFKKH
ncbi:MAG: Glycosyl transferase family 2 [Microgenomates group bacterium GW2011_GWC1_39_7b]|uniref:Glycosyl transferase family 2 n=3 Tax=Candidatus Woeseibacteriota TaxID=1752722 RepID=A0A0G0LJ02_9BACT|nr:MAG: Glycosyl transferase family 2 [Candidatus Woesebacteria bacterium GW2011_GWB1_39_10]KKR27029.1 MAG: Glycosyl transferase family 2 [Microgenomates group bacterium GW2011_GWC1_39_7b]KKR73876.1 MAG: Glycosyl transferase family 2 [Candidatus Woesebacteria bacterium GW2011_GWA2_40_7]KKS90868.1 MAG: Glycosyl transferase family 2 [Candidatus Woesebacteria bacterium GW2011_GWA1_43_12]